MPDLQSPRTVDENYVLEQYQKKIDYYWAASRNNKNSYKRFRTGSVILGALVTLVASISAAEFIQGNEILRITFAILTPVLAATLFIINGLSQNFHWGATWRDMVVNATRLEKERDRFLATAQTRNCETELDILNTIILDETKSFFQRILESEIKTKEPPSTG